MLRPHLIAHFGRLLSSDIAPALRGGALAGEEYVCCDLADGTAVDRLVRRAAAVLHFGGISKEDTFARILQSNILGTYNVFEAARQHGKKRIVYASSSHVIGFHDVGHTLDALSPLRPDTYYGVSKAFGESLASLYVDKHGMDIASLRIGKCVPAPKPGSPRDLSIWLAPDDLVALVVACFAAPKLGHAVLYGVSRSSRAWFAASRVSSQHRRHRCVCAGGTTRAHRKCCSSPRPAPTITRRLPPPHQRHRRRPLRPHSGPRRASRAGASARSATTPSYDRYQSKQSATTAR
eukprot:TRINITY_DN349_c0_g1_i2.p1 TRINITY_DN349_c0_g1~~TRINITY_DN349_c0_g1_i2.p1  ORF type:complete len:318 (+),score=19.72 TRINITY_DN349_c0_g1_i2:80-955(+)